MATGQDPSAITLMDRLAGVCHHCCHWEGFPICSCIFSQDPEGQRSAGGVNVTGPSTNCQGVERKDFIQVPSLTSVEGKDTGPTHTRGN